MIFMKRNIIWDSIRRKSTLVDKSAVMDALKNVLDPEIGKNIVELNMVKDVKISGEHVGVTIALTVAECPMVQTLKDDIEKTLTKLDGIASVGLDTTVMSKEELSKLQQKLQSERSEGIQNQSNVQSGINRLGKGGIRSIIAVVSGKGGVGKSFVTSLLASELVREGFTVGILDADIPGPSIAKILGLKGRPYKGQKGIVPVKSKSGIKVISMSLMTDDPSTPFIWRGPIVTNLIRQLYGDVEWGDLHFLLIDLPPGTSDAPLTVFQSIPLDGVVVVSTPQDLSTEIVSKAISMGKKLNVPVLGLVENMSYLNCPHCNERIELYGKSKTKSLAVKTGVPMIGSVPIDPRIVALSDEGKIEDYQSPEFKDITATVRKNLSNMVEDTKGAIPIVWSSQDSKTKSTRSELPVLK